MMNILFLNACVPFEFANISFLIFFPYKELWLHGWLWNHLEWWPVFILAVNCHILKITQAPKRERDWKQLGNRLLILAHPHPTLQLYIPDTFLSCISQKAVLTFTYQFNVFLMFCKIIMPAFIISYHPNAILRTHKVIVRVTPPLTKGK